MNSKQNKKSFFNELNNRKPSRYWQDIEAENNAANFGDFYFEDFRGKRTSFFNDETRKELEFE
jgi:hypothetical protein